MKTMRMTQPEVGGPYRKVPTFEQMIDIPKKKMPDIDRSGLVAINSYELGYLRDSMAELSNRQLENEAHEAVRRHARQLAEQTGVPARDLIEGTRLVRSQRQAQQFNISDPTLPSTSLTGLPTASNPIGQPLSTLVSQREEVRAEQELTRAFYEAEQKVAVETGVRLARANTAFNTHGFLDHSRSALWHGGALSAHTIGAAATGLSKVSSGMMTIASLFGRGPDTPIDAADMNAPTSSYSFSIPAEREQEAVNIMNYLAGTASGTTADDARRNYEEIEAARRIFGPSEQPSEAASSSSDPVRYTRRSEGIYEKVRIPTFAPKRESIPTFAPKRGSMSEKMAPPLARMGTSLVRQVM